MTSKARQLADPYLRRAEIFRVVDGDTFDLVVDMGFRVFSTQRIRLAGVDAPEIRTKSGQDAKKWAESWLAPRALLAIRSYGPDSFGRWLADVHDAETGERMAVEMIAAGHARPW